MPGRIGALALSLSLIVFAPLPGGRSFAGSIVINEVLYDPPGSDGDQEFVELFSNGDAPAVLSDLELRFVNGADPDHPKTVWRSTTGAWLPEAHFFVIGEAAVLERDVLADLDLQNGPDALQLWRGGRLIDAVGWGKAAVGAEAEPAPDAAGQSIGRVPDGNDSDVNRLDWRILPHPSPGRANLPAMAFRLLEAEVEPAWLARSGTRRLSLKILALGYEPRQMGWWRVDEAPPQLFELAAADSISVGMEIQSPAGRVRLTAEVGTAESDTTGGDRLDIVLQTGPGPIILNEVMARPLSGEPEWIELHNRTAQTIMLEGWSFSDAARRPRALVEDFELSAGGFLLLSADPAALRRLRGIPSEVAVIAPLGGWPTLNNSPSNGAAFADEILLLDDEGAVVDQLVYGESLAADAGRSMERGLVATQAPSVWFPSPGPPTPGRRNEAASVALPGQGLKVEPNPFSPDGDGQSDVLHVLLRLPQPVGEIEAEILDLSGDRVRRLDGGGNDGELRQWLWDGLDALGSPVAAGAYVVLVQATPEGGGGQQSFKALVALGRRR